MLRFIVTTAIIGYISNVRRLTFKLENIFRTTTSWRGIFLIALEK